MDLASPGMSRVASPSQRRRIPDADLGTTLAALTQNDGVKDWYLNHNYENSLAR